MREHPIPQDITGYRFHLIGNMTLKQFAEILLGVAVAFIFYKTNLPDFFKYALAIFSLIIGFAAAFVPIEERPLDHWIVAFFKALYKPTKFYWKKKPKVPEAFKHKAKEVEETTTMEMDTSHIRRNQIQQFLQSVSQPTEQKDQFDLAQEQQANQVLETFNEVQVASSNPVKQVTKPNLKVRTRKIAPIPKKSVVYQAQPTPEPNPNQINSSNPKKEVLKSAQPQASTEPETEPKPKQTTPQQNVPEPIRPTQPNLIVGIVLGANQELINGALIEVKTESDRSVLSTQTNALGQFKISEPLPNNTYKIYVTKNGAEFPIQTVELMGEIVEPLTIQASTN